jgi:hypothetical protein
MDLQTALKTLLDDESVGDFIYSIRDRAGESGEPFEGSSWDHPRVRAYSDAIEALTKFQKELPNLVMRRAKETE